MAFKDEIIADMQATISRLTGELVERSNFEFKLMERVSFLQQQLQIKLLKRQMLLTLTTMQPLKH